jgi:hypothetical protein
LLFHRKASRKEAINSQRLTDIITREVEEEDITIRTVVKARMDSQKESADLIRLSVSPLPKRNNLSVERLINLRKSCGKSQNRSLRRQRVIRIPHRK